MASWMRSDTESRELQLAPRATFIIRLWRERDAPDPTAWRGTVEHVQSGERRGVIDTAAMLALLEVWLAALDAERADPRALLRSWPIGKRQAGVRACGHRPAAPQAASADADDSAAGLACGEEVGDLASPHRRHRAWARSPGAVHRCERGAPDVRWFTCRSCGAPTGN